MKENDEKLASSSFHCELCKKSFRREDLFIAHMFGVHDQIDENSSSVVNSNKTKRKMKGDLLKLSDDLFTIVMDDNNSGVGSKHYKCRLCAHVFLVLQDALEHQKQHDGTSSNPMFCGLCDKHFMRRDKFVNHLETHKGATSFECDKCGKCFASLDSASKHKLRLCTAPVLYKCSLCELSFETEQLLQGHEPCIAEGQVEFRCEPCGETFSVKAVFEEHLRSHEMQIIDPYICTTCGIKLSSKQEYDEHIKTHDYDIYKCHCCSETYNLLEDLEMHYQMSETCIEVTCTDCQINFQSPNDLRMHLKEISAAAVVIDGDTDGVVVVEDAELFVCRFCQRGFHNNDPYVAHLKVHYSDKLKRCDICSETFDNDEKLGIHYKLVHRAAKYPCIECGVIFSDKANLKKHTREIHSNENMFKCLPCGRTFYQRLEFNRHIVTKQHNKRVIETGLADIDQPQLEGIRCPICEKVCANNRELKRHQYDHQRIQSKPKPEKLLNNNQEQQATNQQDDNVSIILNSDAFYNFVDTEHVVLTTSGGGDQQQSPTDLLNAHLDIDSQGNIGIIYVDSSKSEAAANSVANVSDVQLLRKHEKEVDHNEETAIDELLVVDDEVGEAETTSANSITTSSDQHQNITEETFLALSEMLKQGKIDLSSLQVIQDNKEQPK